MPILTFFSIWLLAQPLFLTSVAAQGLRFTPPYAVGLALVQYSEWGWDGTIDCTVFWVDDEVQ